MNPSFVIRIFFIGTIVATIAGCANYGLRYSYPSYGFSYGYPGFGYGYPFGYGFGYGYGPYYQYGYGSGRRYSNTQLWNAYQWLRNNPGGTQLSPGQLRWLRHHR